MLAKSPENAGAKSPFLVGMLLARLKSCPDTKTSRFIFNAVMFLGEISKARCFRGTFLVTRTEDEPYRMAKYS
jgi:hypothetical protein